MLLAPAGPGVWQRQLPGRQGGGWEGNRYKKIGLQHRSSSSPNRTITPTLTRMKGKGQPSERNGLGT